MPEGLPWARAEGRTQARVQRPFDLRRVPKEKATPVSRAGKDGLQVVLTALKDKMVPMDQPAQEIAWQAAAVAARTPLPGGNSLAASQASKVA